MALRYVNHLKVGDQFRFAESDDDLFEIVIPANPGLGYGTPASYEPVNQRGAEFRRTLGGSERVFTAARDEIGETKLVLRLPAALHRQVVEMARSERRSLNGAIVHALEQIVEQRARTGRDA